MKNEIPLERGLTYYYQQQDEFDARGLPTETQAAVCFEAGYQLGRHERQQQIWAQRSTRPAPTH